MVATGWVQWHLKTQPNNKNLFKTRYKKKEERHFLDHRNTYSKLKAS